MSDTGDDSYNKTLLTADTGVYISSLPKMTIDDNFMVSIFGHPVPRHTVKISSSADAVLEIDVETAWRELGLDSGWSNELEVTVNILGV